LSKQPELKKDGQILEIGPGLGPLTELLLEMPVKSWPSKKEPGWWNFCGSGST